jgi:hypothetical protein
VNFNNIIEYVEEKFKIKVESSVVSNMMLMRINGLDNTCLSRYIKNQFPNVKITSREVEGYKFNNSWIKIEE